MPNTYGQPPQQYEVQVRSPGGDWNTHLIRRSLEEAQRFADDLNNRDPAHEYRARERGET